MLWWWLVARQGTAERVPVDTRALPPPPRIHLPDSMVVHIERTLPGLCWPALTVDVLVPCARMSADT